MLLSGEVRKPSSIVPGLPATLDDVVLRALRRHPDERYATAAEFADALENCGVKVATPRQVAALVEELVGESLAQRREDVKKILESGAEFTSLAPPSMPADTGTPLALDDMTLAPARNEAKRTQLIIVASAAAVAIVAFIAIRSGNSNTNSSNPPGQSTTHAGTNSQGSAASANDREHGSDSQAAANTGARTDASGVAPPADPTAQVADAGAAAQQNTQPPTRGAGGSNAVNTGSNAASGAHTTGGSDGSSRSHLAPGGENGASSGGTTGIRHQTNTHRHGREFSPGSI
jgi:hypothetical protein